MILFFQLFYFVYRKEKSVIVDEWRLTIGAVDSGKRCEKIIRNKTILHLDHFTADAGDLVTVVGESGAGKSTLLNILGLNDQFSSGQFYLFDQETKQLTGREALDKRNTISFLFQDFGLIEYETIDFNLDIGLKFSNLNVSDKRTAKYEALKK